MLPFSGNIFPGCSFSGHRGDRVDANAENNQQKSKWEKIGPNFHAHIVDSAILVPVYFTHNQTN